MNEDTVDAVEGLVLTALLYEKKNNIWRTMEKNPTDALHLESLTGFNPDWVKCAALLIGH